MQYKLGRKPSTPDPRTLKFGDYLRAPALAAPPPQSGYYTEVYKWPMYLNDTLGCCTISAWAHLRNLWTKYATGIEGGPTDEEVLAVYDHLSPDNTGCEMLDVLRYATATGIGGHAIVAYAALEPGNITQAELCVSIFGAVYLGLALPDAITCAPSPLEIAWNIPPGETNSPLWAPNENSGHAVIAAGYREPNSSFEIVTWGRVIGMSDTFYRSVCDEAYAVVSQEWLAANGTSPSGFDLDRLLSDRAAIAAAR